MCASSVRKLTFWRTIPVLTVALAGLLILSAGCLAVDVLSAAAPSQVQRLSHALSSWRPATTATRHRTPSRPVGSPSG
jgi:hypothetical protein